MTHDTPPPEWKNMTDWSDLPHVYVTKAESQQGMFWRIEACSVPMAIGPEVRLITASEADAMVAAALREAARAAVEAAFDYWEETKKPVEQRKYGSKGLPACVAAEIKALIPQPASAELDKLIAEAVNEAMLQCIGIVANLRNKRNPGPLFEVLNRAMSDIEDARFAAIREKNNG